MSDNVYEAALKRVRRIFDEFEHVVVSFSGGKDSTVILHLALTVSKEMGRSPLPVLFIDQEAELTYTIDLMRRVMASPDVIPMWYQIPIRIENAATVVGDQYNHCWDKDHPEKWLREKEPFSIKENTYKHDVWEGLFKAVTAKDFSGKRVAFLAGVRAEENPKRLTGLTETLTYKDITWGVTLNKGWHYTFYPIYDWIISDVWKCIHDNRLEYNEVYNVLFRLGEPIKEMRVSNVHHETATKSLYRLQEVDPKLYEAMCVRMAGVDMAGKMREEAFNIKELPSMFSSWEEYRDYLVTKLIAPELQKHYMDKFHALDEQYKLSAYKLEMYRYMIKTIVVGDHLFSNIATWERRPQVWMFRRWKKNPDNAKNTLPQYMRMIPT